MKSIIYISKSTGVKPVSSTDPLPVDLTDTSVTVTGTVVVSEITADTEVVGNVAAGATDSGNPVKVGGVFNETAPAYTDGQRGDLQLDSQGNLKIQNLTPSGNALSRYNQNALSTVKTLDLHADCKIIEVNCESTGVFMRYRAGCTAENYDEYILGDSVRHYRPKSDVTVISFLEAAASATIRVIQKDE